MNFLHSSFLVLALLGTQFGVHAQAKDAEALRRQVAELTPDVIVQRSFGNDLKLRGYSIGESTVRGERRSVIALDEAGGFALTLYFEQLRLEASDFQVLLQGANVVYDERTGMSDPIDPFDVEALTRKLPVDLARAEFSTRVGEARGALKVKLGVRVPRFLIPEGEISLKILLIRSDGSVTDTQFLDSFSLAASPTSSSGEDEELSLVANEDNLLGNASFESPPKVNAEGNWTLWIGRGVTQFLDDTISAHGEKSLRLDFFGGLNMHMYNKHQEVDVEPDTDYELSWYVKSENVTSKRGPRLVVWDTKKGWDHFVESGNGVIGTTPWHKEQFRFHTPPDTTRITVVLERGGVDEWKKAPPADTLISGSVWFDLVELVEIM